MGRIKQPRRIFTDIELQIIKDNSGKVNIKELSLLLNINYTSLSTAMNEQRVPFAPRKSVRKPTVVPSASMVKIKNNKGENIVTDELLKEWAYLI